MATKGFYRKTVRNAAGTAISGASVTVDELDGSPATIEDAGGAPLSQPLTTDSNGVFAFYVLFGSYDITVTNGGDVVPLPQQLVGPDQASLASAGSVIGQVALFATGVPLGDYVLLDGTAYSTATYPDLAPLMTALPPSYTEVAGTPTLAGVGNGVFADADYVYAVHFSSPYLTILNRSDFTEVAGTPTLAGTGRGIFADADYVYIGHDSSPYLTILNRSDFTVVAGTPTLAERGQGIFADADYVYVVHDVTPFLTILNRSDFTVVAGTPILAARGWDIFADADYVYAAHSGSPYLTIVNFLDNGFEVPTVASPDPVLEYRIRAL